MSLRKYADHGGDVMSHDARQQLLELIDRKVFNPILNASLDDYTDEKRRALLQDLQQTTRRTKQRYHEFYKTAQEVRDNYRDDLSSSAAEKAQRQSRTLHMPTLDDIKDDFERLADRLGVGRDGEVRGNVSS
jgi:hypothetical protein